YMQVFTCLNDRQASSCMSSALRICGLSPEVQRPLSASPGAWPRKWLRHIYSEMCSGTFRYKGVPGASVIVGRRCEHRRYLLPQGFRREHVAENVVATGFRTDKASGSSSAS